MSGPMLPERGYRRLNHQVREFIRRLWEKSYEDDVFFMAGAIAFNALVALIPLIILGIGLAGYVLSARFGDPTVGLLSLFDQLLPATGGGAATVDALRGPVEDVLTQRGGFTTFGAIFFVLLATRLVASLRIALREIFDVGQSRGLIAGTLFDVFVVLVGVVLLTLNMGVTVVLGGVATLGFEILGLQESTLSLAHVIVGQTLGLVSIWVLFLIMYRYLPARRISWRTAVVAASFSALMHESLKFGFSWYATEVADYGSTLGNLATGAVLIFWIYYGSVVFVLGGEVAQVYTMRKASRVGVVSFGAEP